MCHPAKMSHPTDGRAPGEDSHQSPQRHPRDVRDVRDGRTRGNGYKNGLDFIITLVVVNFRIVHLLHRLILVILS